MINRNQRAWGTMTLLEIHRGESTRMAMLNLTQGDWLRFDRGQKWATRRRFFRRMEGFGWDKDRGVRKK